MTTGVLLITLTAIAGLAATGLWMIRPRPRAAIARPLPEDIFAYTMYDDPC
jgi:hypothetical protein